MAQILKKILAVRFGGVEELLLRRSTAEEYRRGVPPRTAAGLETP